MATYTIEPVRENLHGTFSRDYPPVLTINSGDTVQFRTLDSGWHLRPFVTNEEEQAYKFEPRVQERDSGHALCGPIFIRRAQPGMTLAVHIKVVLPGTWGWTIGGCVQSALNKQLGVTEDCELLHWSLNASTLTGKDQYGHTLALHP